MPKDAAAIARAEAMFKKKERLATEGQVAWSDYQKQAEATTANMHRLRALRLARDQKPVVVRRKRAKS